MKEVMDDNIESVLSGRRTAVEKEIGSMWSFRRIKIEPTKGIPTRFLGPTALPEPLADMLIKQVSRWKGKKYLTFFFVYS